MMNLKDLNTYYEIVPLQDSSNTIFGLAIISYEIKRYRDLRNLVETFAYQVLCTHRIIIPNSTSYTPATSSSRFTNYPAIVMNKLVCSQSSPSSEIVSYFPRTLNASVQTSVSTAASTSSSATIQHTSGSSSSESNSFSASASLGLLGDGPTGDLSGGSDHTWGTERSKSLSTGRDAGNERQLGVSDSMSIKDWACNTYLGTDGSLMWIWGQEYPWDVIRYGVVNNTLPAFIQSLLYDGAQLLPPSQLSQFGLDFTMKVSWTVQPAGMPVTFTHTVNYYTATHQLDGSALTASINGPQQFTYISPSTLDVCTYGLDPITNEGQTRVAIIGFVPRQFLVPPVPAQVNGGQITNPVPFKILSSSNTLLIQDTTPYANLTTADSGAGFTPSETALTVTFTQNCTSLTMSLSFKLVDTVNSYKLLMKHWKTDSQGVMVTITINGDSSNSIVKYVDALEAEGGESNLLSISLRDLSYGSADYHDYLNLGFNSILITFTPLGSLSNCGYQIRAISIEKD